MPRAWKAMLTWLSMLHKNKDHEEVQVMFEDDMHGEESDVLQGEEK